MILCNRFTREMLKLLLVEETCIRVTLKESAVTRREWKGKHESSRKNDEKRPKAHRASGV